MIETGFKEQDLVILTGDASSRRYWRVPRENAILAHDPQRESYQDFLSIREYLNQIGVAVPQVIKSFENHYYLLEDIGDDTFLIKLSNQTQKGEYFWYKKAIDTLHLIQKQPQENIPSRVFERSFDCNKFSYEIDMTLNYFCRIILKLPEDKIEEIHNDYHAIIKKIASQIRCFSHRDYHSRNLMVKDEELIVIDFQDARMGLPHYDLVSLLEDCYIDTGSANRKRLIDYYWERRNKNLFPYNNLESFYEIYYLTLLQRVFKAIGSFAYIYKTRADIRYLKYIGFAMEKIRRTIREVKIANNLRNSLLKPYYES